MLLLLLISFLASAHAEGYLKGGSRPSAFQVQQATVQDTLRGALSVSDIQQPYSFSFESGGTSSKTYRQETGDASGVVQGLYTVSDPRGHSRVVQYTADEHGFHADIQTDEPYQQSHNPANVRFVSTNRKGSSAGLYGGSQVKGGSGLKSVARQYKIGQSQIPYGATGLDFYSYPNQRYTQSRIGTGVSKTSGPFGQQKVTPGDISQGKLHFTIGDSQKKSPAFVSSTKGSYRTGQSQIPYGLSGFDYYSYPSQRYRQTKTSSLSTKTSGVGAKGVAGRGIGPAFLGSTGVSSVKGPGSGSGPFAQRQVQERISPAVPSKAFRGVSQVTGGSAKGNFQFKLGDSDVFYKIGQSQIPYGASGFDYYSYPAQRYRSPQVKSHAASKTSRFGGKGGTGGGIGPAFLGSTGVSSAKGTGSGRGPFTQVQERISPVVPSKTIRGISSGSAKGNFQFKLGDAHVSYKIGQSQIPYGASGFDYYSYPAQRYRGPQVKSLTASKTSRFGAKGGTGSGIGPAFLGSTGVSSVKGTGSGSGPFTQVQERISPAVPSKTIRGISSGSAKGNFQFKLGDADVSYKIGQSQIPYGASGFDYYSYPAQRYRSPQVKSLTASKTSRFGAKGGTGGGIGPAFLGSTGVSSVKGTGSGRGPFTQVQERISPAVRSKTFRGVSQVAGGSAKGNYQFKLGDADVSYKIGQSQIPYGASGFDYYSYPEQRYRRPQVKSPIVSKTSRFGAKGATGGGIGPAFLGSTGVSSVKGIGSGSGPFAQRQVQERISPVVTSKTFRGVSQVTDGTAQFKLGDSQVAYKIGQSQIPYGASGFDYYSYPALALRQTPAFGKTTRSVKGGTKGTFGGLKGGIASSTGFSSGIGKGTVSIGAVKGGSQISQTAFTIGDIQRKSPTFVPSPYHKGQSQIPYGASGLDYYSYPELRYRQTKSTGVKGGSLSSFLGATSGGIKGATQGRLLSSSSGSIKGSTKGGFPGVSLGSATGGIKSGVGSQKRPYRIGQSSIPYGASGFDFSSYPTQRHTLSHGGPAFSIKTSPSLYSQTGGLGGVKSVAGSRIKGGYSSIPSRKSRDTSSLSKINRGSVTGQEKINIKLVSEVTQGKIEPQVPIATKSVVTSTKKTTGGITTKTVVGDGAVGKKTVTQVKTHSGSTGGTKSSVSGIKSKSLGTSTTRKAGVYKVSQEKVGQEKVGQEKVVQSDIGGQRGETVGITLGGLHALTGQGQLSSATSSSTDSQAGILGGQSDASFSFSGDQIVSGRGRSTGAAGSGVSSSTSGLGGSAAVLSGHGTSSRVSGSYSSDLSQGPRTAYSTYDSSENPAKIEFSLGGGEGFSTYGTSSQSSGSATGAVRGSGISLGAARDSSSSVRGESGGHRSRQITSSQLSYIDQARSRVGISGIGTAGGRRAAIRTTDAGQGAAGIQRTSLSHGIGSEIDNPAKIELSLGEGYGFSTYSTSGLGEGVSTGGGITAGAAGRRTGASLRSRATTSGTGESFSRSTAQDFSSSTRATGAHVSGISSTSGVRGALSDLENPAKIEFSLGGGQGFSTYGSSVGTGASSARTGVSHGVSGGAGALGRAELSGRTGARGVSGRAGARGVTGTVGARSGVSSARGALGAAGNVDGVTGTVGSAFRSQRTSPGVSGAYSGSVTQRRASSAVRSSEGLAYGAAARGAQVSSGVSEAAGYTSYEGPSKVEFLVGGGQGASSLAGQRGTASLRADTSSGSVTGVGGDASVRSRGTLASGQGVYSGRTSHRTSSSSGIRGSGTGGTSGYVSSDGPAHIEFFLGDGQGFSTYGTSSRSGVTSSSGVAVGTGGAVGAGGAGAALLSRGVSDGARAVYSGRTSQRTSFARTSSSSSDASRSGAQISSGIGPSTGYTSTEDSPAKIEFFLDEGQGFSTFSSLHRGSGASSGVTTGRSRVSPARVSGSRTGATLTSGGSTLDSSGLQSGVSLGESLSYTIGGTGDYISSGQSAGFTGEGTARRSEAGAGVRSRGSLSATSRRTGLRTSTVTQTSGTSHQAGITGSRRTSVATGAISDSENPAKIEFSLGGGPGFTTYGSSAQGGVSATRGAVVSSELRGSGGEAALRSRGTRVGSSAVYGGRSSQRVSTATRTSGALEGSTVGGAQVAPTLGATTGYTSYEGPSKVEFLLGSGQGSPSSIASGQRGVTSTGRAVTGAQVGSRSAVSGLRGTSAGSGQVYGGRISQRTSTSGIASTASSSGVVDSEVSSGLGRGSAGYVSSEGPAQIEFFLGGGEGFSTFGTSGQGGTVSSRREAGVSRAALQSGVTSSISGRSSSAGVVATRRSAASYQAGGSGTSVGSGVDASSGFSSLDSPAKIEFQIGHGEGFSTYGTSGQVGVSTGGISRSTGADSGAALRSRGVLKPLPGGQTSSARSSATRYAARVTDSRVSSGLGATGGYTSVEGPAKIEFRLGDGQGFSTYGSSGQTGVTSSGAVTSTGAARRGSAAFRSRGTAGGSGVAATRRTAGVTSSELTSNERISSTRASTSGSGAGAVGARVSSGVGAGTGYSTLEGPGKIEFFLGEGQGFSTYGTSGQAGVTSSGAATSAGAARGGSAALRSRGTAGSSGGFAARGTSGITSAGLRSSGGAGSGGSALLRSRGAGAVSSGVSSGRISEGISTSSRGSTAGISSRTSGAQLTSYTAGTVRDYSSEDNPAKILFSLGEGQGFSTFGSSSGAAARGSAAGGSLAGVSAGGASGITTGGVVRTSSADSGISVGHEGLTSSRASSVTSTTGQRRGSSRQEELRRSQATSISGEVDRIGSVDLGGYSSDGSSGLSSAISYTSPPKPGTGGVVQQQEQVSIGGSSNVVTDGVTQQKLEQIFV